jgi:hypothetical protein
MNATANIPCQKKTHHFFVSYEYGYIKSRCHTQPASKQRKCIMMKSAKYRMVELVFME